MRHGRAAVILALLVMQVVVVADPAWAHGAGGADATNYQTVITRTNPPVDGLSVAPIDVGDRLELRNETGRDVIVLGYEDEPYLRIGRQGPSTTTSRPSLTGSGATAVRKIREPV